MTTYVLRRLLQAIPLLVGISIIVFVMLQMTPGGPLAFIENPAASGRLTPEDLARLRARYGLDEPMHVRYLRWGWDLLGGDWGTSFSTGRPVLVTIAERVPPTLLVTGLSFLLTIVISFPIGVIAAVRRQSLADYAATGFALAGVATPRFWSALMLLYVFSYGLGWLPAVGLSDPRQRYEGWAAFTDTARHLVMPVVVMTLYAAAGLTRYVRSSMLDVLNQDYVRTARAKGVAHHLVITRHALRNALLPAVTILAIQVPHLFVGSAIVEAIFAIPGVGRLFLDSANSRDYPVLMGIMLIASALVILSNLVADVIYGVLDPRIRLA